MLIFSEGVKYRQYASFDEALPPGASDKQDAVVAYLLHLHLQVVARHPQLLQADLHLLPLRH